jgi:2-dehydropantoate 2-reductase
MRIAVIGAGGVGGYLGAQLAASGQDVVFVARGEHLVAMQRRGLRIDSARAPEHLNPVQVTDSFADLGQIDLALIAVKLWDTNEVAQLITPCLAPDGVVLSLQNGVKKDEILRSHVQPDQLIGGVCYISAVIESPGVIRHEGLLARVILGEFDGSCSERVMRIFEALNGHAVDVELSSAISEAIWRKFVFLVGLSSVTSATRQSIGVLRERERSRELLHDVMSEVVRVARARGIRLAADFADQQLEFIDTLPERMGSSMLNDLMRGRRLELPWLGNSAVEMARALCMPTPANDVLAAVLDPYVDGGR